MKTNARMKRVRAKAAPTKVQTQSVHFLSFSEYRRKYLWQEDRRRCWGFGQTFYNEYIILKKINPDLIFASNERYWDLNIISAFGPSFSRLSIFLAEIERLFLNWVSRVDSFFNKDMNNDSELTAISDYFNVALADHSGASNILPTQASNILEKLSDGLLLCYLMNSLSKKGNVIE